MDDELQSFLRKVDSHPGMCFVLLYFFMDRPGQQVSGHQKKEFDPQVSVHKKGDGDAADDRDYFVLIPQVQIDMKKDNDGSEQKAKQLDAVVSLFFPDFFCRFFTQGIFRPFHSICVQGVFRPFFICKNL